MNFDYYPVFTFYNSDTNYYIWDNFLDKNLDKKIIKRNKQILYYIRHIRTGISGGKLQGIWWRIFVKRWREL